MLKPGTPVILQSPKTKRWTEKGTILSARRPDNRSFVIATDDGQKIRTRNHIRFNNNVEVKEFIPDPEEHSSFATCEEESEE